MSARRNLLLAALLLPLPALAAPTIDATVTHVCNISAYGRDEDPKGTNVRVGPSKTAEIVDQLPPMKEYDDAGKIFPEFTIIGARDGWFLIAGVSRPSFADGEEDLQRPDIHGWISARLVDFEIGLPDLRAAPKVDAKIIGHFSGESDGGSWGPDSVAIERVHDCSGSFAEVDAKTPDGKKVHGWVAGICSSQVTTCDPAVELYEDHDGKLVNATPQ